MVYCYKDKERECNENCAAFCSEKRHGVNCLDLATSIEGLERAKKLTSSTELNAVYMKVLSQTMDSFKEDVMGMMRD